MTTAKPSDPANRESCLGVIATVTVILVILVLSLGGCHDARPLDVKVISSGDVRFYVRPDQRHKAEDNCFGGIGLYFLPKKGDYANSKLVWETYNTSEGRQCINTIKFPHIPQGFSVKSNIKSLQKGHYQAIAEIGVSYATTEFDIK